MHTCACSVSVGAAESCGTALSVADAVLFPCAQAPPDRTWEPDHHTRRSPEKPTITTKTSPYPAEVPVSCVQYRGQPHPLGTSGSLTTNPPQIRTGTRPILNAECGVSGHLRQCLVGGELVVWGVVCLVGVVVVGVAHGSLGPLRGEVSFCWNDGLLRRGSCVVIGLPCAVRGVYAHGSRTIVATKITFPHDSAVPTDAGHGRVCTIDRPCRARASGQGFSC